MVFLSRSLRLAAGLQSSQNNAKYAEYSNTFNARMIGAVKVNLRPNECTCIVREHCFPERALSALSRAGLFLEMSDATLQPRATKPSQMSDTFTRNFYYYFVSFIFVCVMQATRSNIMSTRTRKLALPTAALCVPAGTVQPNIEIKTIHSA